MTGSATQPEGYRVPLHRALTEPILMAGSPRLPAIINGTLAAAIGIGMQLWVVGLLYWVMAHGICVFTAKRDAQFTDVLIRHVRHKGYLSC